MEKMQKIESKQKLIHFFKKFSIYLFPLFVVMRHLFEENTFIFIKEYWILYLLGFGLLSYTYCFYYYSKDEKIDNFIRKIYFIYTYFFILYVFPKINVKYNVWQKNEGIFKLNTEVSTVIVISIISFIIYIFVFLDFHISEISFGNTKISMLKEKYNKEVSNHFENINQLVRKIEIEGFLIGNMNEYCQKVLDRISEKEIDFFMEYQILLTEYYNKQEEKIRVTILKELDECELKKDFGFKSREIDILKYKLEQYKELYSTKLNNIYYLFIPF